MVSTDPFECILSSMEIASIAIQATISTDILHSQGNDGNDQVKGNGKLLTKSSDSRMGIIIPDIPQTGPKHIHNLRFPNQVN